MLGAVNLNGKTTQYPVDDGGQGGILGLSLHIKREGIGVKGQFL